MDSLSLETQYKGGFQPAIGIRSLVIGGLKPALPKPASLLPAGTPFPSVVPSAANAGRKKRLRCLSPQGEFAKLPAPCLRREGSPKGHDSGVCFFAYLCCTSKKVGRPPGRDPANGQSRGGDSRSTQRGGAESLRLEEAFSNAWTRPWRRGWCSSK